MKLDAIHHAINRVLTEGASLYTASKEIGMTSSNLRYWIMKNPATASAYAKLQEADPERKPLNLEWVDPSELAKHPAVLAVVNDGLSYAKAAEMYGLSPTGLHKWVKRLYPDGIGRTRGRPRLNELHMPSDHQPTTQPDLLPTDTSPPLDHTHAVLTPITASIQAAATVLGLTYHQVLAKLLEQAATQAPTNPT